MTIINKHTTFVISLSICVLILPEASYAQSALFDSGTNFLTALQDLLTSTWARLIGIIGIFALGCMATMGRLRWAVAASVIGGIILIFGAPAIVDGIAGSI